jgi:hypothetical protein
MGLLAAAVAAVALVAWRKGLGPWAAKDNGQQGGDGSAAGTAEVGIGREDERGGRA